MLLEIVKFPAKVLQRPARKINGADEVDLHRLFADMRESMFDAGGIGLAAPQIGQSIRFFIAHDTESGTTRAFVNPQITAASTETEVGSEGCLSFPGLYGDIERHLAIKVTYLDLDLQPQEERFSGWFARIVQHENDHLNGILLTDRSIGELYTYEQEEAGTAEVETPGDGIRT